MKPFVLTAVLAATLIGAGCQGAAPSNTPASASVSQANDADRAFIDGMVPHHESAVMMGQDALSKATRAELKAFAQKVIDDQSREIAEMKAWRQSWFGSSQTPGMDHGAHQVIGAGTDYDRQWAEAMIVHHQGALDMARQALGAASRSETKALAQRIIDAQQQEIQQLRAWADAWK